ncbi:formin 1, putative [Plasmodium relictum]|uniref:Formin 1, putative n=1 Tax=Plasmodium relictum TaxID=85471 RepID=A0A1J1HA93_PLARL|nr:formin 1, putative [Plasmodium relictum]CRH00354.1 formin 1, putative [Plasmodium relictum]
MENKTITLATINDIENGKNVDTLSMITKMDLKLNNSKNGNTTKIRNINFEDSLKMNEEQIKVKEAVFILQNLENFNYSISYSEIQNIRNDLRLFAVNSYHDKKYSDCLIQAIHSYMIAKKYYSKFYGFYLTGDMSTELILICKCYVLIEKYEEGKKYLQELKFLIDNTLLYTHKKGIINEQQQKKENEQSSNVKNEISNIKNLDSNYEEPIILCGIEVLSNILYIFADLLSLYKENEEAEKYFLKYLYIIEKTFNIDSLNYSDALNDVCSYYIKNREYVKALATCEQILEIRKKYFGDYDSESPSEVIADCYCNLGLLLRLLGNSIESLHKYLIAVDMRMRIHKTRYTIEVQDILFSFAIIMHQLNNFKISLQLYKEVYSFYKNYYGPDDINTTIAFKLIEELEKDIMKKSDRNETNANLEDYMGNINEKSIRDNKMDKNCNSFNEKLKNIPKSGDIDPNLIENLMNERILINTKNPYKNLGDKKTLLTLEGNFRYNDLSYCSIDAYKHMQSNKEFEIVKSSFFTTSSINRIKSLYADSWKNTLIPSTYILPFVETKLVDEKLVQLSECKDFQNAIIFKRKILPIVNIPLIERGYVKLENDEPIMICNEDAKVLLNEWNIKEPFVDSQGNVVSKYEGFDEEFHMFISILDENNDIMLGFYNNPLLVPNPAIYHCIILSDPSYFDRYNRSHGLYSYNTLQTNNKKSKDMKNVDFKDLDKDNLHVYSNADSSDSKDNSESIKNSGEINSNSIFDSLKSIEKDIENAEIKNNIINKKYLLSDTELFNKNKTSDIMKEHVPKDGYTMEANISKPKIMLKMEKVPKNILGSNLMSNLNKKKSINELMKKPIIKSSSSTINKVDTDISKENSDKNQDDFDSSKNDIKSKSFSQMKHDNIIESKISDAKSTLKKNSKSSMDLNKKKNSFKEKKHIFKMKNNNSTRLFSKEKYVLKKFSKLTTSSKSTNEKSKLLNYKNSVIVDTLEKSNRIIKFKKEPIVKSSIDQNIKLDLQNNMKKITEFDTNNFKREIYYDEFPSNNYTNSINLSFDDDKETVASYGEYQKNKKVYSSNKYTRENKYFRLKSHLINKNKKRNKNKIFPLNEENDRNVEGFSDRNDKSFSENDSEKNTKDDNIIYNENNNESNDEDIVDLYKVFDVNLSSDNSNHELDLNYLKEKENNPKHNSYSIIKYINNKKNEKMKESKNHISSNHTISENSENEKNFDIKNVNLNEIQNKAINYNAKSSEFLLKNKIKNIKNIKNSDILFKFDFNKEESFSNENSLSERNSRSNEIDKKNLANDIYLDHLKLNDKRVKKMLEDNESSTSSVLHSENKKIINLENSKENKLNIHLTKKEFFLKNKDRCTFKNNNLKKIDANVEEILLSENEEFYDEFIKNTKIDEEKFFFDTEKNKNFLKDNENIILYKNEHINTNNDDKSDVMSHKNGKREIDDESNSFDKIFEDNNTNDSCNGEATYLEKVKNKIIDDSQRGILADNLFLSSSIEELDSNLVTNKYKSNDLNSVRSEIQNNSKINNVIDNSQEDISLFAGSDIYNEKKHLKSNDYNCSEKEDNIKLDENYYINMKKNEENKLKREDKLKLDETNKIKMNSYDNVVHYDNQIHVKNSHIKNEKEKNKEEIKTNFSLDKYECSNLINSIKNIDNINYTEGICNINSITDFAKVNHFDNDIYNIDNTDNVNHLNNKKKKKKKKYFLPLNKKTHILKLFSYFTKKKSKKKEKLEMCNGYVNYIPFNKEGSMHMISNSVNDMSLENNNAIFLNKLDNTSLKKKKKKFLSESIHGMEKPKLSLKTKNLTLKKLIMMKKDSPIMKNNDEKNEPLSRSSSIIKSERKENKSGTILKQLSKDNIIKADLNEEEKVVINNIKNTIKKESTEDNKTKGVFKNIPKSIINKKENNENTMKSTKAENGIKENIDNNNNDEVKIAKNINDKLSFDLLKKIKFCKIGFENDDSLGTLPVVHLLDNDKKLIAIVPWQIDLTSFTLAKSSIEEETVRKLGLMSRKLELTIDERKKDIEKETKLLSGEGLKELGLLRTSGISKDSIHGEGLITGIDVNALKTAYRIEKKSEPKEKVVKVSKETPKSTKTKGGKKEPPKFMKGPPKNIKGGPILGKGKVAKMKNVKDEGKTKRFFWEALFEDDIKGTLFEEKKDLIKKIAIEKENVEKCFAKAVSKKEETKESKIKKPKVIQLLPDSKREYNMSIALSKFNNYTFKEIRDAIMDLNPEILNLDNTEVLMQYVPTSEEIEIVKEYINSNGDLNLVDKPEQYVSALIGVPLLKQRLESHYFALSFKENYENTLNPLESILESCEAIKNSTNLFTILFTILNVGNTLNYGDTQRGNASGFKLTTLSKLNDIRSSTRPIKTLLQYICEIIYEKNAETLNIIDELRCIEKVTKTEKQTIDSLLQKLKLGSNKIKNVLEQAKKNPSDPLYEALTEFYYSIEPKIVELESFYDQTFSVFKEVAIYLGYKEKEVSTIQVHVFFKELWNFIQSVEFNRKTLNEAVIKKLKKQEQALATEKQGISSNKKQNFTIIKKKAKEPTAKPTKKTFKIF